MIDTKALRSRVLDLAIRGKLTEQFESDGTAEEFYRQIQEEKQKLIKEGKIKKEKPLPAIKDEEIPFEIPESWKWVRLKSLCSFSSGKTPSMSESDFWNGDIPWVSSKDMKTRIITDSEMHITALGAESMQIYPAGTLLLVVRSGILRRMLPLCVLGVDSTINQDLKALSLYDLSISPWLYFAIKAFEPYILKNLVKAMTTVESLKFDEFSEMLLPLPPLAEQKRIVERVEEIFRLLDAIDEAQEKYAADAESLKAKLITACIQGKLTEQLDSDGTADELYQQIQEEKQKLIKEGKIKKEKSLPAISDEEIPFEIPGNWKWVRLGEICRSIMDGDHQPPPQTKEGIPFLVISNISNGALDYSNTRYVSKEYFEKLSAERIAEKGDILFTVTGSFGIPVKVEVDTEFCFQRHIALLKKFQTINIDYLYHVLLSQLIKKQSDAVAIGVAQRTVGIKSLRNMVVPLPPLAEQKRIAEVLERAMGVLG